MDFALSPREIFHVLESVYISDKIFDHEDFISGYSFVSFHNGFEHT